MRMPPHSEESREAVDGRRRRSSVGSSNGVGGGMGSPSPTLSPATGTSPSLSPSPPVSLQLHHHQPQAPVAPPVPPFHLPALPPMAHLTALANSLPPLPEVLWGRSKDLAVSPPFNATPQRRDPRLALPAAGAKSSSRDPMAIVAAESAPRRRRPVVRFASPRDKSSCDDDDLASPAEDTDDEDYIKMFSDYSIRKQDALPPLPPGPVVLAPFVRVNPNPLAQPDAPDFLPVDHNLPQLLRQVTGSQDLSSVQSVRVRVVAREMSLQRLCLYMPRLRELHLDGSLLGSLRDLGCGLSCLGVLSVSNCGLDSLDGTFGLTTLKELYACDNKIDDASLCTSLPHIRIVDLKRNHVQDIGYIGFLSICTELRYLSLVGCPVSSLPGYRPALINMLPQLTHLDGISVNEGRMELSDEEGFFEDADDVDEESEDVISNANIAGEGSSADSAAVASVESSETLSEAAPREGPPASKSSPAASRSSSEEEGITSSSADEELGSIARPHRRLLRPLTASTIRPISAASTARPPSALERPSSSGSCGRPGYPRGGSARLRPATAGSTASSTNTSQESSVECPPPLLRSDSPSVLTSGGIVCGNLAAALRARRQRAAAAVAAAAAATAAIAWGPDDDDEEEQSEEGKRGTAATDADASTASNTSTSGEAAADASISNALEDATVSSVSSDALDQDIFIPPRLDLLESSRRWRRVFNSYREKNRDKWLEETNEENRTNVQAEANGEGENVDTVGAEKKNEENTLEDTPAAKELKKEPPKESKEKERYRPPPCCAMMHMLRNADRNWDCESSGRKDSSSESSERGSRSRGHEFMRF